MSVTDIKKINVRSPYYISVSKDETAGTAITEPQTSVETLACGGTATAGVDVGTRKFNIDISDRVIGTFTVALTGITVPIKYRLGYADNMPAFATVGIDEYQEAWTAATGETTGLISSSVPLSVDATYTSTQSDIDTYGTTIQLEIQQPMIADGWSAALSCPVRKNDAEASDGGFVTIITILPEYNNKVNQVCMEKMTINDTLVKTINDTDRDRFVMSDISPNLTPNGFTSSDNPIQRNFYNGTLVDDMDQWFKNTGNTGQNTNVTYLNEDILGSGINTIKVVGSICNNNTLQFKMRVARHPVEDISGTLYVRGNHTGDDIEALECSVTLPNIFPNESSEFVMNFNGSNNTELAGINAFVRYPDLGGPEIVEEVPIFNRTLNGI